MAQRPVIVRLPPPPPKFQILRTVPRTLSILGLLSVDFSSGLALRHCLISSKHLHGFTRQARLRLRCCCSLLLRFVQSVACAGGLRAGASCEVGWMLLKMSVSTQSHLVGTA